MDFYIPEDDILHSHRRKTPKSFKFNQLHFTGLLGSDNNTLIILKHNDFPLEIIYF
jgi:hypothetical protein